MKDDASAQLKALDAKFRAAGASSGSGFSAGFSQSSRGLLGGIFGHGGSSVTATAQAQGQNIGTGLARGINQKFSQTMGSGLLGGLFGTSGGNKLFGSAGASVVQDAQKQGQNIAAGLSKGIVSGMDSNKGAISGAFSGLLGGMMPGIGGLSGMQATIGGLGGSLLGMLPALAAVGAGIGTIGAGVSIIGMSAKGLIGKKDTKQNPNAQGPLYQQAQDANLALSAMFQQASGGMLQSLKQAFSAIPGIVKQVTPALTALLSGAGSMVMPLVNGIGNLAKQVLPLLGSAFRAAAPLIKPLLDGITKLATGLLPGVINILKAAAPAFQALSSILGTLGKDVGGMLSSFAPVISASSVIFKALGDVISAIFPIVGKLAAMFASALAPAFMQVAGLVKGLLPVLSVIGNVIASFAGAVLADLVGVLGTVATLVKDLSPSFTILGKALGQVFNVMENSGVFAILGDAVENLAPLLANLINTLVKGLAPAIPAIITMVSDFSNALITLMSAGLSIVITGLTAVLKWLTPILPLLLEVYAAVKLWTIAQGLLDIALDANPIALLVIAVGGLIGIIIELVKNWGTVEKFFSKLWSDVLGIFTGALSAVESALSKAWSTVNGALQTAWNAISSWLHNWWYVILLGVFTGGIGIIVALLAKNWGSIESTAKSIWGRITSFFSTTWDGIKRTFSDAAGAVEKTFSDAWNNVHDTTTTVWGKITSFFVSLKKTLGIAFSDAVGAVASAWGKIKDVFKAPVNFLINTVYMGGIRRFWDDVVNAVGLKGLDLPVVNGLSTGGHLSGYGGGDSVMAMLEPGEAVVDKDRTRKYAPLLKAMGVPGFASGGVVGSIFGDLAAGAKMALAMTTGNPVAFANAFSSMLPGGNGGAGGELASVIATAPGAIVMDLVKGVWAKLQKGYKLTAAELIKNSTQGTESGGPGGGAPGANAALARKLHPDWGGGPFWSAWNSVAMRESGWNQFAQNAQSGAYGIPQSLPYTKMPKAAWPASAGGSSNPTAQINWMYDYIRSVYGNPVNAWAHELSAGWYDNGGWLKPGWTMAYNGTGKPEPVGAAAGGGVVQLEISGGGQSEVEQFMLYMMRNLVRVKGGGNVQQAFGRN